MADADAAVVLAIGSAIAVLANEAPAGKAERDVLVQSHLRALTGLVGIVIERRPSGRPRLAAPFPELGISLSSRNARVLAGFSPDRRVGADLEPDMPQIDAPALARDHFTAAEAGFVASRGSAVAARDAFLRLWVAKEAALKITGRGIYDGLAEPDCAVIAEALLRDGVVAELPASSRLPAVRLAVRACRKDGAVLYCALAAEA